jgi:hypothetical protein
MRAKVAGRAQGHGAIGAMSEAERRTRMEVTINQPWSFKLCFEPKLRAAIESIDVLRSGEPMQFGEVLDHVSLALAEHYGIEIRAVTDEEGNRCAAFPRWLIDEAFVIVTELWGPLYGLEPREDKGEFVELLNDGNARVRVRRGAPPAVVSLVMDVAERLKAAAKQPQQRPYVPDDEDDWWPSDGSGRHG